jgi:hypothetical protein
MANVEIHNNDGRPIRSFSDWERYAMPPDRQKKHWQEGKSASELGRLWTATGAPSVPKILTDLLDSHPQTRGAVLTSGITECETSIPPGPRGPRCHDLALVAMRDFCNITICVEAKSDESFGKTVAGELRQALKRKGRFPDRLEWLTRSLFGFPAFRNNAHDVVADEISDMGYQLMTATAGAILEAGIQGTAEAVLVFHTFRTRKTEDKKIERNDAELNRFLRLVLRQNGAADETFELRYGKLFGPVPLLDRDVGKHRKLPKVPLFVGKIRTDCTTEAIAV